MVLNVVQGVKCVTTVAVTPTRFTRANPLARLALSALCVMLA